LISHWMLKILITEYFIVMIFCLIEKKYDMSMYWFGAIVLNMAVLRMG